MDYSLEDLSLLWLQYAPVSAWRGIDRAISEYGNAEGVYREFGVQMESSFGHEGFELLRKLRVAGLDRLVTELDQKGIVPLFRHRDGYPSQLKNIPNPPRVLFCKGNLPEANMPSVAVIGARRDTRYGRTQAGRIARELAQNSVAVISGLARGIDTAAHEGALEGNGTTVAVLGNGLDTVYPPENKDLAERIVRSGGAVISEYAPGSKPMGYHFPIRNRIISGLSDAVLLIEAMRKSGTASTVNHALAQGREVFALPGNVDAPGSELPLYLLREGANLCTCAEDILQTMHWRHHLHQTTLFENISDEEEKDPVIRSLQREEKSFEELMDETQLNTQDLNIRLTLLELEGKIKKHGGQTYSLIRP